MVTIQLTGRITAEGKLEVELPAGLPAQEVNVSIDIDAAAEVPEELRPWTAEEIAEMLKPGIPKTGAEIAARILAEGGGWEDLGITDGAEWVEEQRRKSREQRGLQW